MAVLDCAVVDCGTSNSFTTMAYVSSARRRTRSAN
jgi:hypothetical protein